jgi:hypothetical protein
MASTRKIGPPFRNPVAAVTMGTESEAKPAMVNSRFRLNHGSRLLAIEGPEAAPMAAVPNPRLGMGRFDPDLSLGNLAISSNVNVEAVIKKIVRI